MLTQLRELLAMSEASEEELLSAVKALQGKRKPAKRAIVTSPGTYDRRLPSNISPHTQMPISAEMRASVKSPARAAKMRTEGYAFCACRLCALALNPPATLEEWARFVPSDIAAECEAIHPAHCVPDAPRSHLTVVGGADAR